MKIFHHIYLRRSQIFSIWFHFGSVKILSAMYIMDLLTFKAKTFYIYYFSMAAILVFGIFQNNCITPLGTCNFTTHTNVFIHTLPIIYYQLNSL